MIIKMNKKETVCYESDASQLRGDVEKVVFAKSVNDIQKIVKTTGIDIIPRGAGTGLVGGCVPNNSIIIDLGKMNSVLDFDPVKSSVSVEAGITLKELNEKLRAKGFEFPIIPGNKGISSIGGMIATNASGSRSMRYGRIKEWVEEIEFVNGRGELMKVGKADLGDVCGMEGITGIIVNAKLKIMPFIMRSASIFQTDDLEEILSISRRLKLEKEVVMLAVFPPFVSRLLGFPEKYHMIIEFDSQRGKIKGEEYKIISSLKDKVYSVLAEESYIYSEDPKFFFDKLREFILFLEQKQIPYFGYLGDGIIHPFFKNKEEKQDVFSFIKKTKAKLGKYGIGLMRKSFLDAFEIKIIRRVKLRHDPFGKLNKNKVINFEKSDFISSSFEKINSKTASSSEEEGRNSAEERLLFSDKGMNYSEEKELSCFDDSREIKRDLSKIGLIKPKLGEDKSARRLLEEFRTPEEKLNEFIEEVEEEEKEEVKNKLLDYEKTFKSELENKNRERIEEFAKNVSRQIVNKPAEHAEQGSVHTISQVSEDTRNRNHAEQGLVIVTDNLERKSGPSVQDIMAKGFGVKMGSAQSTESRTHTAQSPAVEKKPIKETSVKSSSASTSFNVQDIINDKLNNVEETTSSEWTTSSQVSLDASQSSDKASLDASQSSADDRSRNSAIEKKDNDKELIDRIMTNKFRKDENEYRN